jgi:UDP:flavonoid glycosyltransferase YjiC (YdhE family)
VAEYRGVPHYRITFGPMMVGYQDHPLLPWQGLPPLVNRAAWVLINGGLELMVRGPLNRNRASLGLPPLRGIGEWVARFGHTLFAMNTTLAPPCHSWGRTYEFTYTGYCHEPAEGALPQELERFIEGGTPPVYIGFGSVSLKDPAAFTRMVLDAVVLSGQRVVLGAGWTGLGRGAVSDRVFVVGDLPHTVLFPRMAAVLHHGGAGTTHTVAKAGVPQLVMPQFADQFYWGHRVRALGLGPEPVSPARLSSRKLARVLRTLVQDRRFARHAAALGHAMRDEDGVASIVAVIEAREGHGRAPARSQGRLEVAASS